MKDIINLFIKDAELAMINNIKEKHERLNQKIYDGPILGSYATEIIKKRYDLCLEYIARLSNQDKSISEAAAAFLNECNCMEDTNLPCIHKIYQKIINNDQMTSLIHCNEIPNINWFQKIGPSFY